MPHKSRNIRIIWAICLLIAAANHARILVQHGLDWDYGGAHPASVFYWSSLTLVDPLVAALLFLRPKAGIVATVILITTNVLHNLWVTATRVGAGALFTHAANPMMLSQIAFMLFVAATAHRAWKTDE